MAATYKILSALLTYPGEELQAAAGAFAQILEDEAMLPAADRQALDRLIKQIADEDLYELQERYVQLFDRTRSVSLHLFEHVHGESRDRGQAMVDLTDLYEQNGLEITANELPDHLPMFLEFLSILPANEARDHLAQPVHIIAALRERLIKRKSPYAAVFRALETLARAKPDAAAVAAVLAEPETDPDDLEAIDAEWEEAAVMFGPGAPDDDSCPQVSDMLAHMDVPQGTPLGASASAPSHSTAPPASADTLADGQ
ncbi:MAG: nitrate reductase molybdenum cofactor assembly chaperone [Proteobacteria bacterium]|nr:nitrate reductase molybdenum cofactor assembly chaperone [Pseudomonadota bacterium]